MSIQKWLVVGGGIAGCNLAITMYLKGIKFDMVDSSNPNAASRIAAGLFNPILLKRYRKTWLADALFKVHTDFYPLVRDKVGGSFFFPTGIVHVNESQQQQNEWDALVADKDFKEYLQDFPFENIPDFVSAPYGAIAVKNAGWLDTNEYLNRCHSFFNEIGSYYKDFVEEESLTWNADGILWKGRQYSGVIFCNGLFATDVSFLSGIKFRPVKGEILTVRLKGVAYDKILHQQVFLMPIGNGLFKVGATYQWVNNNAVTSEGKTELLEKLSSFIKLKPEVIEHQAGVRPASLDRRPVIGKIKEKSNTYVFNGMGSKGITLTPYFADIFTDFLTGKNVTIPKEVNIQRFYK